MKIDSKEWEEETEKEVKKKLEVREKKLKMNRK